MRNQFQVKWLTALVVAFGLMAVSHAEEPAATPAPSTPAAWVPPLSTDWFSITPHLQAAFKANPGCGGSGTGMCLSVDRTTGTLYGFPQGGPAWFSTDQGQTFQLLNKDVKNWGFIETPYSLNVSPDGLKMTIGSSTTKGYSADGGKTWKLFNYHEPYGFEYCSMNWDEDAKTILARRHCSTGRICISRDGGETFTDITTKENNGMNMGLLDGGVILAQPGGAMVRSDDFGKTWTTVELPTYPGTKNKIQVIGIPRRFKGKTYWITTKGIYTTPDSGKTWVLEGNLFPLFMREGWKGVGPILNFGKDESHMIVYGNGYVYETQNGSKDWHKLANLPKDAAFLTYDPIGDILYCGAHHHGGPSYILSRLALKRWGMTDITVPLKPEKLVATPLAQGNGMKLSWEASVGKNKVDWYRLYQNNVSLGYVCGTGTVINGLSWNTHYDFSVKAIDDWQNVSESATVSADMPAAPPADGVFLSDLEWTAVALPEGIKGEVKKDINAVGAELAVPSSAYEQLSTANSFAAWKYTKGLSVPVKGNEPKASTVTYALGKKYIRFVCDIGFKFAPGNSIQPYGNYAVFTIEADGVKKYASAKMPAHSTAVSLDLDLADVETLVLSISATTNPAKQVIELDWANAMLFKK